MLCFRGMLLHLSFGAEERGNAGSLACVLLELPHSFLVPLFLKLTDVMNLDCDHVYSARRIAPRGS